jgi:hypothetical protein
VNLSYLIIWQLCWISNYWAALTTQGGNFSENQSKNGFSLIINNKYSIRWNYPAFALFFLFDTLSISAGTLYNKLKRITRDVRYHQVASDAGNAWNDFEAIYDGYLASSLANLSLIFETSANNRVKFTVISSCRLCMLAWGCWSSKENGTVNVM